jgi:predicted helicase
MRNSPSTYFFLTEYFSFDRPELRDQRSAIRRIWSHFPNSRFLAGFHVRQATHSTPALRNAFYAFIKVCKEEIGTSFYQNDAYEIIIQHVFIEELFNRIFGDDRFYCHSIISRKIRKAIRVFISDNAIRGILGGLKNYYEAIGKVAGVISGYREKQRFLKIAYESFYKSYNSDEEDSLGVVYTPDEIVRFMIEGADYLLEKNFGRRLEDRNVIITDPATGTGTFICELLEYIPVGKLEYKYRNEIFANEVSILPYYVGRLNIEYTCMQKTGEYIKFDNIRFIDTLKRRRNAPRPSSESEKTSRDDEEKKLSVIIGNPPYYANRTNAAEENKREEYWEIDKRIRETFIKYGTAKKTKNYDMYSRFLRWAMDNINDSGIVTFISNNSFIDTKAFDGFRKALSCEFSRAYIINLKGNARTGGEQRRREGGNVFHDHVRVGVAIYFLIKTERKEDFTVHYAEVKDFLTDEEKLKWISENKIPDIPFEVIYPDDNHNWINITDNDFESLLPLCNKDVKYGRGNNALFELYFAGAPTNRDAWVYDIDRENLKRKAQYLSSTYNECVITGKENKSIKWSRDLRDKLKRKTVSEYDESLIIHGIYRPFHKLFHYTEKVLNDVLTQNHYDVFGLNLSRENRVIAITGIGMFSPYYCIAIDRLPHLQITPNGQCLPMFRYDKNGQAVDNITDWGLEKFMVHYNNDRITKTNIFHYVYAVLHNPAYRKKYEKNLKRELPRIPLYDNFTQWANWGEELMSLHLNYEKATPYPLLTVSRPSAPLPFKEHAAILKADREAGIIFLDATTELHNVPPEAWNYKLGNRSALEWILDRYQEKSPKDQTIAAKFNTYRFADYKSQVTDLLKRICTVSIATVEITDKMERASGQPHQAAT